MATGAGVPGATAVLETSFGGAATGRAPVGATGFVWAAGLLSMSLVAFWMRGDFGVSGDASLIALACFSTGFFALWSIFATTAALALDELTDSTGFLVTEALLLADFADDFVFSVLLLPALAALMLAVLAAPFAAERATARTWEADDFDVFEADFPVADLLVAALLWADFPAAFAPPRAA